MLDGNEAVVESYMRLIYRLERRNVTWKISNLTIINEADTLSPAIPGTDRPETVQPVYDKAEAWLAGK